jgi:hypothetical protein
VRTGPFGHTAKRDPGRGVAGDVIDQRHPFLVAHDGASTALELWRLDDNYKLIYAPMAHMSIQQRRGAPLFQSCDPLRRAAMRLPATASQHTTGELLRENHGTSQYGRDKPGEFFAGILR